MKKTLISIMLAAALAMPVSAFAEFGYGGGGSSDFGNPTFGGNANAMDFRRLKMKEEPIVPLLREYLRLLKIYYALLLARS